MLRRVLSVLRRQPGLLRSAFAGAAALGLALACLNPQNDDLPSNLGRDGVQPGASPAAEGQGNSAEPPPVDSAPGGGELDPQAPAGDGDNGGLAPPSAEPDPTPSPGEDTSEPDAGAAPDAGSAADPSAAP